MVVYFSNFLIITSFALHTSAFCQFFRSIVGEFSHQTFEFLTKQQSLRETGTVYLKSVFLLLLIWIPIWGCQMSDRALPARLPNSLAFQTKADVRQNIKLANFVCQ